MNIFLISLFFTISYNFQFDLEAKNFKCFTEELSNNFDVYGEYNAYPGYSQYIDFKVEDKNGNKLVTRHNVEGKGDFSFVTRVGGEFKFCFYNRLAPGIPYHYGLSRKIEMKLYTGTETRDYENVARKEHLKPIEINLKMMEDIVKSIYKDYNYFKEKERLTRDINDSTHTRVLYLSIFSIVFMIASGAWQVIYLKGFFVKKKIV